MKTKLLYVLVSTEKDIYLEQAFISMTSARFHMPDVHISLVIDKITADSLIGNRKKILDLVTETVVVELPKELSGQKRSRLLKTSCRNHVKGDFLFIDCDTVILQSLEELDLMPYKLAACRDSHAQLSNNPYRKMCSRHCEKIGCDITNENDYFNSGVIFAKDCPEVHKFYTRWHENWKDGEKCGIFMDQPSFAQTNITFNHMISQLPDIWNCQIIHGIKYLNNAKILHYLCTSPTRKGDKELFILRDRNCFENLKKDLSVPVKITDCFTDPFKGINECVHVLSGKNVDLCQTESFRFLERKNGGFLFKILEAILRVDNLTNKVFKRIIR